MGTAIMVLSIAVLLLFWDARLKLYAALSRKMVRRHLNRVVANMARQLFAIVKCYGGINIELDPALRRSVPNPTLVCANHQSVADIVVLMAALSEHNLRFVAKAELAHGFPAVSEVLRNQRHALINRKGDFRKTATELKRLGRETASGNSPVVFPEGTRSRTGDVKEFHSGAVRTILDHAPLPITAVAMDGGARFVTMRDLTSGLSSVTYRAKLVGVFEHDGRKESIQDAVRNARDTIVSQVNQWHSRGGESQAGDST